VEQTVFLSLEDVAMLPLGKVSVTHLYDIVHDPALFLKKVLHQIYYRILFTTPRSRAR
jgi:hypothetical protein